MTSEKYLAKRTLNICQKMYIFINKIIYPQEIDTHVTQPTMFQN